MDFDSGAVSPTRSFDRSEEEESVNPVHEGASVPVQDPRIKTMSHDQRQEMAKQFQLPTFDVEETHNPLGSDSDEEVDILAGMGLSAEEAAAAAGKVQAMQRGKLARRQLAASQANGTSLVPEHLERDDALCAEVIETVRALTPV
jgi:hypothetical protein